MKVSGREEVGKEISRMRDRHYCKMVVMIDQVEVGVAQEVVMVEVVERSPWSGDRENGGSGSLLLGHWF